jgi:hypothetical protein
MSVGYLLFLQEQIKGINIFDHARAARPHSSVNQGVAIVAVSPNIHEPRRIGYPSGSLKQWLRRNEIQRFVKEDDGSAKLFAHNQREIIGENLANTIRDNPSLFYKERVDRADLSRCVLLGAALVTWLNETEETFEVFRKDLEEQSG